MGNHLCLVPESFFTRSNILTNVQPGECDEIPSHVADRNHPKC